MTFVPGQRWHSLTEPELGLGLVAAVDGREVVISYPAREVVRRYAAEDAPLARARLSVGQHARGEGLEFEIAEVVEHDGLLVYSGGGHELAECGLDSLLDVATPENRLRTAQADEPELFDLRLSALTMQHRMLASPARGFLGGRIRLFDHQLSIARDVCERHRIRVLLADEVGLGKTIEALLILHRLLLSGRIERALILVPPALVHQWLAEAYLKFNLLLRVLGRDTAGFDIEHDEEQDDDLPSALMSGQLFVCPFDEEMERALGNTDWDLVIVDEAHHLEPGTSEFELIEKLAHHVEHVVMLSATPDRDGEAGHFRRLHLLDPARFADYDAYQEEAAHYRELADTAERLQQGQPLTAADRTLLAQRLSSADRDDWIERAAKGDARAQKTLLERMLDLHGIGRVMFRNVRARIPGFPERRPQVAFDTDDAGISGPHRAVLLAEFLADVGRGPETPHKVGNDPRTEWLKDFLAEHPDEKVLVLCSTRDKAEAFATALTSRKRDVARFHEDMSSIERDRQAAWFLADDGPQILVSSAIGAEGRNFQVARNLVLLDLPTTPDRLEQLIGRVDRIGQGDEVHIYAATLPGTPQDRLRRYFDEALNIFSSPWHGSPAIDREFGEELIEAALAADDAAIDSLIERARTRNDAILHELETGRDRLLELTSFDAKAATELSQLLVTTEQDADLEEFMVDAFDGSDLDAEYLGRRSYTLRPGDNYHRPFPGFIGQEMAVTFDREVGLDHPERVLLTRDHPMVFDTIQTLLSRETGNASVARTREAEGRGLLLDALFVAEPTVARALRADRFFAPTPIRTVVNLLGQPADPELVPDPGTLLPTDTAILENPQLMDRLQDLVEAARALAEDNLQALADAARQRMRDELEPQVARLTELCADDPQLQPDLDAARTELETLDQDLAKGRTRLDALRVILL